MPSSFDDFLKRNSVEAANGIHPLVHTTKSFNLKEIIADCGLSPKLCEVYGDSLLYFFVGRPAYEWLNTSGMPRDWELPTCFVFDELPELIPERTLPFDSGAHDGYRYPSYVNDIPVANFQSSRSDASRRIISAFYGSFSHYLHGKPKSQIALTEEFSLNPLHAEVLAIIELANDIGSPNIDHRRLSIEVQSKNTVSFDKDYPSAVILPTPYLKVDEVVEAINEWGCEVLNYDTFGLSLSSYFGQVFMKFTDYCQKKGYA